MAQAQDSGNAAMPRRVLGGDTGLDAKARIFMQKAHQWRPTNSFYAGGPSRENARMPDSHAELQRQNRELTRQLLEWIEGGAHTYAEALDVWRSSCPRHTIWEDALEAGYIDCGADRAAALELTASGRAFLEAE